MSESVFNRDKIWKYRFDAELDVTQLAGGIPNDPKVAKGWLKARLFGEEGRDADLADMVAQTMEERGVSMEEALEQTPLRVNGFKRIDGALVIEGRIVKAMLKENFSIAAQGGHVKSGQAWGAGTTKKGLLGFVAEHVQVPDRFIPLWHPDAERMLTPDDLGEPRQRFTSTHRGQSIKYEEVVDCRVKFTVISDWNFSDDDWEAVWCEAEENGLGSSRSQDSGKFHVTKWEPATTTTKRRRKTT
jgi:hypothetical protein